LKDIVSEIITIGTEITLGKIIDTNSAFISQELIKIGITTPIKSSVDDNFKRISQLLNHAIKRSNVIITTGGLGPTEDDITRNVIAEVFNKKLVLHPEILGHIESFFKTRGYSMTENNKRQAYIPEGAIIIPNPIGTAYGFLIEINSYLIFSLPGVPREVRLMVKNFVIPFLEKRFSNFLSFVEIRELNLAGISESKIDHLIGDIIRKSENPSIGLQTSDRRIKIRIVAKSHARSEAIELIKNAERIIIDRVGKHIFSEGDTSLGEVVKKLISINKLDFLVIDGIKGVLINSLNDIQLGIVISKLEELSLLFPDVKLKPNSFDPKIYGKEITLKMAKRFSKEIVLLVTAESKEKDDKTEKMKVYITLYFKGETNFKEYNFQGDPQQNCERAATLALFLLFKRLRKEFGNSFLNS